jgi:hypothetical protein
VVDAVDVPRVADPTAEKRHHDGPVGTSTAGRTAEPAAYLTDSSPSDGATARCQHCPCVRSARRRRRRWRGGARGCAGCVACHA